MKKLSVNLEIAAKGLRELTASIKECEAIFKRIAAEHAAENRDVCDTEPHVDDPDNWWMRGEEPPGFES